MPFPANNGKVKHDGKATISDTGINQTVAYRGRGAEIQRYAALSGSLVEKSQAQFPATDLHQRSKILVRWRLG
jgi:hypothetical protein